MLSYVPVMTFDELAGLKNANVEKLKGMMTEEIKSMRDAYERASPKRVITTFWGCTNKDINGLIRDETGNRRFFQIATKKVDVGEMQKIDSLKIWRSVDENAISPLYAHPEDLQIVKEIQAEQRHKSSVEDWLENCAAIPHGPDEWLSTTALFTSYVAYVQVYHPSEAKLVNLTRFGRELSRLHGCGHPQIEQRLNSKSKTNTYRITPRDQFEADGERSERVRAKVVESLKTTPPAANTNTAATTIRRDELGFPLPEEPSKVAIPTSSTGISLDAIHDALHASGGTPAIEGMMEKIMHQRRA